MGAYGSPELFTPEPGKPKKKVAVGVVIAVILILLLLLFGLTGMGWSAAFGVIGFFGIVAYLICLIVAAVKKKSKKPYTFGIIASLAFVVIGVAIPSQPSAQPSAKAPSAASAPAPSSVASAAQSAVKPSESEITSIDYKKLYANDSEYKDKYVRIAAKVNHVDNKYITINDGLGGGMNQIIVYWDGTAPANAKEGDYAVAVGKVGIKALGSLALNNGYIESSGTTAKAKYDEYEKASAKSEADAAKSFKASCKTYKYKDVARKPDAYKGKSAKFTGKVAQVQESGSSVVLRVNVTKGEYDMWDDTIYVEYERKSDSESRILEDDIVTMYGALNGIKKYTAVLGNEISIPLLEAKYIDIIQ